MDEWIAKLFADPALGLMGHAQRAESGDLGLGWIYYGLARVMRPRQVVVIGSWRGFVPLILGKALVDNGEGAEVCFVDPSHVDDFWRDPARVAGHFARFGIDNVRHHLMTTQQFAATEAFRALAPVGMLFIDGYHTEAQARFDFEAFRARMGTEAVVLLHDSLRERTSRIYGEGREYVHSVKRFVAALAADPGLQVFDLPWGDGVTLVRRIPRDAGAADG